VDEAAEALPARGTPGGREHGPPTAPTRPVLATRGELDARDGGMELGFDAAGQGLASDTAPGVRRGLPA